MSTLTVIKFYCDDEIKRVPMNRSMGDFTYDELCVIVQRVWKSKLSTDVNNLILKYVDDEGDQICLENDIDVTHALSFSSCLKVHVYDKETIPVNSKSLISNLTLEEKSLESIKAVVKNSRDTLNKIIEKLDSIKLETQSQAKTENEIKPLSNAELSEFLGDQNDATKTSIEESSAPPAVADQTVSSIPPPNEVSANAPVSSALDQGSIVQTPNSIHPTLTSQPSVSAFNQPSAATPQLSQANTISGQSFASPSTAYPPPPQSTASANATTPAMGSSQPPAYQKTNSFSSNINANPSSQASTASTNMYASAPPPASYSSSYSANTPATQYGSTSATSQYGNTNTTSQYGSAPGATSTSAPPPSSSSQYPPPPTSSTSSTTPYSQNSTTGASNPSSYQRYPQTPTYGSGSMPSTSVPPPPQSNTYGNTNMQKPYGYGAAPYGNANSSTYGNNPYNSYNNNQGQNAYSRPNNSYGNNPNPYY